MERMIEEIASLSLAGLREDLPAWLAEHVGGADATAQSRICRELSDALHMCEEPDLLAALEHYSLVGSEYRLYMANPVARKIGRAYMRELAIDPVVEGVEHLQKAMAQGPCLLVSNHLSYADSQFTDQLLSEVDVAGIADRLVFIAGPKVYSDAFRRLAAAGLNTLQTAQSSRLTHNAAGLSPREIARIAIATVRRTRSLMDEGYLPLLYGEGSRSRSGRLGPYLRGVGRYPDGRTQIVPLALEGTREAFPMHQRQLFHCPISIRLGAPILVGSRPPLEAMEEAWHALSSLLSPERRPEAGIPATV